MQINDVFNRLEDKKKQLKDRKQRVKDDLANNSRYVEIEEQIAELKRERKQIEMETITMADKEEMEAMKVDIRTDKELLSDMALNEYVGGHKVEVVDEFRRPHEPVFSAKFKKV